ncbi:MAG TPA: hypothetical protein VJ482_13160 [Acidimicrobiia bacterium]|jgi:hypothetical protein|nr:hypothetical protein [Acidimicrobiia bacterium]
MTDLLCQRCDTPALVIYAREPLCGPCALEALDERHHYLVVQVDDRVRPTEDGADTDTTTSNPA